MRYIQSSQLLKVNLLPMDFREHDPFSAWLIKIQFPAAATRDWELNSHRGLLRESFQKTVLDTNLQNRIKTDQLQNAWITIGTKFQSNADMSKSNHCVRKDAGLNPEDSIHGGHLVALAFSQLKPIKMMVSVIALKTTPSRSFVLPINLLSSQVKSITVTFPSTRGIYTQNSLYSRQIILT
mgnify:CR=1 FL=1